MEGIFGPVPIPTNQLLFAPSRACNGSSQRVYYFRCGALQLIMMWAGLTSGLYCARCGFSFVASAIIYVKSNNFTLDGRNIAIAAVIALGTVGLPTMVVRTHLWPLSSCWRCRWKYPWCRILAYGISLPRFAYCHSVYLPSCQPNFVRCLSSFNLIGLIKGCHRWWLRRSGRLCYGY